MSSTPYRATLFAAILSFGLAASIDRNALFERASCPADFSQCPGSLPADFCCPNGQVCIALARNTTALCCPSGVNCDNIQPISCQISLQNAATNPTALVKTTALYGILGHCGDGTCCPFGYTCATQGTQTLCVQNPNQDVAPSQSPSTATTPVTSSATAAPATASITSSSTQGSVPSSTSGSSSAQTSTITSTVASGQSQSSGSGASPASIAGGVIGSLLGAALITLGLVLYCRSRRKSKPRSVPKLSRSTSSFGNIIGNPIMQEGYGRTDFIRPPETSPSSGSRSRAAAAFGVRTSAGSDPFVDPVAQSFSRDLHDGDVSPVSSSSSSAHRESQISALIVPPIRNMRPSNTTAPNNTKPGGGRRPFTPAPRLDDQPTESIGVFLAPPKIENIRSSQVTTFSSMMEQVGLAGVGKGRPFVPTSARGTPNSRWK